MAVPDHVVALLEYEDETAAFLLPVCLTLAPPPSSVVPVGQLTVEGPEVLPTVLPALAPQVRSPSWWCR
jgi:hypothetical protein